MLYIVNVHTSYSNPAFGNHHAVLALKLSVICLTTYDRTHLGKLAGKTVTRCLVVLEALWVLFPTLIVTTCVHPEVNRIV